MNVSTELSSSLDNLQDIILPQAVSWWPLATGFWLLLALLLVWVLAIAICFSIRYQKNAYRREALKYLGRIELQLVSPAGRSTALSEMAILLKRVALSVYDRSEVAQLSSDDWLQFLDKTGRTHAFTGSAAAVLGRVNWQNGAADKLSEKDLDSIKRTVRRWIRQHRIVSKS